MNKSVVKKYSIAIISYGLLGLSLYWGTLLIIFSVRDLFQTIRISLSLGQGVYILIGLIAWLNGWHYYRKLKKLSPGQLWQQFYQREKPIILLTITLTLIFLIIIFLQTRVAIANQWLTLLQIVSLPAIFGANILAVIAVNTRRFLPGLAPINSLGWIIGLGFQIIFFYYLSRLIHWPIKKLTNILR